MYFLVTSLNSITIYPKRFKLLVNSIHKLKKLFHILYRKESLYKASFSIYNKHGYNGVFSLIKYQKHLVEVHQTSQSPNKEL